MNEESKNPVCPKCGSTKFLVKVFQWQEAYIDTDYIVQDTSNAKGYAVLEIDQDSLKCAECGFEPIAMLAPEDQPI